MIWYYHMQQLQVTQSAICLLLPIYHLVWSMKFMLTLRDEQSDQYSHWNKLYVAGHWIFHINCEKDRTDNLFLFSFSFLQHRRSGRRRGNCLLARQNSKHQNTVSVEHTPDQKQWDSAPPSRGTAHNHQYAIHNHPGLLVLLEQVQTWPFVMQQSQPAVCLGYQCHLWNSITAKKQQCPCRADSSYPCCRP